MRYRAFLSYSHSDTKWAAWLHRALESYRVPTRVSSPDGKELPKRLSPIFRDREELPSTADLSHAVSEALRDSESLIVVCSPQAAASRWVNEEIRTFRRLGREDRIFCFVIDGEPGSDDSNDCFPAALTEPDDNGHTAPEPVAADARSQGDGRKNAMLKLVAGMLGVRFDALRQRDLRRRQRQMAFITAGSMTIAVVTILLAVSAVVARNEADLRRTQAENLIDFMLGDLQEQLREIGRLDVFESVGDKALEYFASQRDGDDSAYTLAQRARNLRQIGEIRMEQGNLDASLEAFEESILVTGRLAENDADDAQLQIDLANSLFYVGYVHLQRGALDDAQSYFEKVIPIVENVSAREPANPKWLVERAYAQTNLGRVLERKGEFEDALSSYQKVMDVNKRLIELESENSEWVLELGFAHNNIGKLVLALGRLDEAESHYRSDLDIKQRLVEANSNHNVWRSYLAVSQYYLGQLLRIKGKLKEGEQQLADARENFSYLLDIDPERKRWEARRAVIDRELGELYVHNDQVAKGRQYLATSIQTLQELVRNDPDNVHWRGNLTRSLLVAADTDSQYERDRATENLRFAIEHIAVLLEQDPGNLGTRELAAYADVCTASIAAHEDPDGALRSAQAALEKIDQYFRGSSDPRILALTTAARKHLESH